MRNLGEEAFKKGNSASCSWDRPTCGRLQGSSGERLSGATDSVPSSSANRLGLIRLPLRLVLSESVSDSFLK